MRFNANLSADERERIAYLSGQTQLAAILAEAGEAQYIVEEFDNLGIELTDVEQLQKADVEQQERIEKWEELSNDGAEALTRIIEDLLTFNGKARGERKQTLASIIDALLDARKLIEDGPGL